MPGNTLGLGSVRLYGDLDVSLGRLQGERSAEGHWRVAGSDGLIGLRVTEGWGAEQSLELRLEHGWSADTGAAADDPRTSFGRQSWIGWRSPLGEARFGRQLSPLYEVMTRLDPVQARGIGSMLRLGGGRAERFDNLASWRTRGSEVQLQLAFAPGEQADPNHGRNRYAAAIELEREHWYAALADVQQNSADGLHKTRASLVGVTHAIGSGQLKLAFYRGDDQGARIDDSVDGKYYSTWSLGVEQRPAPRWRLAAMLGLAYDTGPAREHARQFSLGAACALGLHTELYGLATWLQQPRGQRFSLAGDGGGEARQSGWQLGLRHRI